jgi:uncharacterized protein (TIGR02996 family)
MPRSKRCVTSSATRSTRSLLRSRWRRDEALKERAIRCAQPPIAEQSVGVVTEAELFDAIYADPDGNTARLVYMDYLLDRGDPRGEFLALQMRGHASALDPDELRRERSLLHANLTSWVPPEVLGKIQRSSVRFERGFLARCRLRQSEQSAGSVQHGHPAWRTVHTIDAPGAGFGANRVLLAPELVGVRHVKLYAPSEFVVLYLGDPQIKEVETLFVSGLWHPRGDPAQVRLAIVEQLLATRAFRNLRYVHLELGGSEPPSWIPPWLPALLAGCKLLDQLEALVLDDINRHIWETLLPSELQGRAPYVRFRWSDGVDLNTQFVWKSS